MASARKVYAVTGDSRYASAGEVIETTVSAAAAAGVADRVVATQTKERAHVSDSDIVTNSGFVRPIDSTMVGWMKPTAVVPLMWETWEFRGSDIDLEACRRREILVLGTDEGKPPFPMFDYVGLLALKLLFELGLEGLRTRVLVLGGGRMGSSIVDVLRRSGCVVTGVSGDSAYGALAAAWRAKGASFDAILCAEHEDPRLLIGDEGVLTSADLADLPNVRVGVVAGNVQRDALVAARTRFLPDMIQPFGFMSYQPYSLGPRPVLELFASGLKVGWAMATARRRGLDLAAAERFALENSPAMAFHSGSER